MVITVGRQYGSGGKEIGKKLAEYYNIPFYDKELLKVAAKESGSTASTSAPRAFFIPLRWTRIPSPCTM